VVVVVLESLEEDTGDTQQMLVANAASASVVALTFWLTVQWLTTAGSCHLWLGTRLLPSQCFTAPKTRLQSSRTRPDHEVGSPRGTKHARL